MCCESRFSYIEDVTGYISLVVNLVKSNQVCSWGPVFLFHTLRRTHIHKSLYGISTTIPWLPSGIGIGFSHQGDVADFIPRVGFRLAGFE